MCTIEDTVEFLSRLLDEERVRWGTRAGTRALRESRRCWGCAGFLDDTRMSALARDNAISESTAHAYRDEGIAVLAAQKPALPGALLAAKAAGHSYVI